MQRITFFIGIKNKTKFFLFQNLNNLLENYLEPLKRETFLSNAEINALFGNIQEIVTFQRQFLQNLDHAIEMEADFNNFDHASQFKVIYKPVVSLIIIYLTDFLRVLTTLESQMECWKRANTFPNFFMLEFKLKKKNWGGS